MPANPTSLPHNPTNFLLSQSLRLPPPVISIRIKHEHAAIRKCHIEDVAKDEENYECGPLQPGGASGSFVERREGDEREEKDEGECDSVTEYGGGHFAIG